MLRAKILSTGYTQVNNPILKFSIDKIIHKVIKFCERHDKVI